jgi:hypothetical protein
MPPSISIAVLDDDTKITLRVPSADQGFLHIPVTSVSAQ